MSAPRSRPRRLAARLKPRGNEQTAALNRIIGAIDVYLYANEHRTDGTRRSVYSGPNREALMGGPVPSGSDVATEWERLIHPADWPEHLAHRDRLRRGEPSTVRYRLRGYDGVTRWVRAHSVPHHVDGRVFVDGVVADVTREVEAEEALLHAEQELRRQVARNEFQALHDALTGLGNRRKLMVDLEEAVRTAGDQYPWLLVLFDLDGFKLYNDSFGHPAGDRLLARLGDRLRAAVADHSSAYRLGGDEFCVLSAVADLDAEALLEHLSVSLQEVGDGFAVSSSFGAVFLPAEAGSGEDALGLADQRLYQHKRQRSGQRGRAHDVLLQALLEREPELHGHTTDVAALAREIAGRLALEPEVQERVLHAALMHDIGKIAVPDSILRKEGPLDDDEWAYVREHTVVGERILAASPALVEVARVVRSTHERLDGTGYPDGLTGGAIPLEARIIAVCNAYSALTRERPYRHAVDPAEAMMEIARCAGTQFDPVVVTALHAVLESPRPASGSPSMP
jgi:diguanylate cyclase (GGDEF)-like protein